jgi:hypothetical protein
MLKTVSIFSCTNTYCVEGHIRCTRCVQYLAGLLPMLHQQLCLSLYYRHSVPHFQSMLFIFLGTLNVLESYNIVKATICSQSPKKFSVVYLWVTLGMCKDMVHVRIPVVVMLSLLLLLFWRLVPCDICCCFFFKHYVWQHHISICAFMLKADVMHGYDTILMLTLGRFL